MRQLIIFSVITLLLISAGPVFAEIYKYTDENGVVHFVDELAQVPKKYRKKVKTLDDLPAVNITTSPPVTKKLKQTPEEPRQQPQQKEAFNGTVELYVTSWCGYCKKAARYMSEKGIPYVSYDIEKDKSAKQRFDELGGGGVPMILIGKQKLSGFNPKAIDMYTGK